MEVIKRYQIHIWLLALVALGGYGLFAYELKRSDHLLLFTSYTVLFLIGIFITVYFIRNRKPWGFIFLFGLLFRCTFLLVTPHLSDDYFRFTWDGELQNDGISAFAFLPIDYGSVFEKHSPLFDKYEGLYNARTAEFPDGMNSKIYYSIYPTVNQFIFKTASFIGSPNDGNLVIMRIWLLIAEVVSFFILRALLLRSKRSEALVGLYWLNPLIIIEITGNLHFDGLAITFILLTLLYISQKKTTMAGTAVAMAIVTKLNPLFILGAAFNRMTLKTFIWFAGSASLLTVLLLALILDTDTFWNFKNSFGLYFAWFGFNAGPYYLIRETGLLLSQTDISNIISAVFPIITIALFAYVSITSKKDIVQKLLLLFVIYFSFSPVVHPWYLTVLIPLAILSKKLYPILWGFLAFFTYCTYGENCGESNAVIFIEYGLVYLLMYLEYKKSSKIIEKVKGLLFA